MPLQTVVVYAATKGYLDKVAPNKITEAEEAILKHVDPNIYKVSVASCSHARACSSPTVGCVLKSTVVCWELTLLTNIVYPLRRS